MRKLFRSQHRQTQGFGENPQYYGKFGLKGHEGGDYVPTGSDWTVYALEDGIVVKDEDNKKSGAYGVYVTILHPTIKKATQYCHLEYNLVDNGQQVKKGQALGKMGATGNTSGAHVHLNFFNVDDNGVRLNRDNGYLGGTDPLPFLEEVDAVDQAELDKLRTERDKNWDLYQGELKKAGDLQNELNEIKRQRDESDKAIITLNQKIADLTSAIEKDAVEDKDNLLYAKSLEDKIAERDREIERLKAEKEAPVINEWEPILEEFFRNLVRGKRAKSLWERVKKYLIRYFD